MKLNAVGVVSSNLQRTVAFYQSLGFQFPEFKVDDPHVEPLTTDGSARLMIDTHELVESLIGEAPKPSNHSAFAIECDSPAEVDAIATRVKEAGFTVTKEPWDAFWGQRYAVVEDPDGYKVDLYASL